MKYVTFLVAAGLLLVGTSSYGQTLRNVTPISKSTGLTTAVSLVSAANPNRVTVSIQNLDTTNAVCFSWTTATPVCGAAGTFTLDPGTVSGDYAFWPNGSAPNTALYMRAAAGTPIVSVTEGF